MNKNFFTTSKMAAMAQASGPGAAVEFVVTEPKKIS